MNSDFPRIITYLRKQKGLSQKEVSSDLGISQSLLSHYEKGIRECGLEFLVKIADYYDVSTDYLLGRSSIPASAEIKVEDIPDTKDVEDINRGKINSYCLINRKIITNTTGIIYSLLSEIGSKKLSKYISQYIMTAEYNAIRIINSLSDKDTNKEYNVPYALTENYCQASMTLDLLRIKELKLNQNDKIKIDLSSKTLSLKYPESYGSLFNLIKNSEDNIKQKFRV